MKTLLLTLAIVTLLSPVAAQATTTIFYKSSPTSWVGQGQTDTVTADDVRYRIVSTFWNNTLASFGMGAYDFLYLDISSRPGYPSEYYSLSLGTEPGDTSIALGRYDNASRSGTMTTDQPHLDFSMNSRGNNTTAGWFELLDWRIDQYGDVEGFAVDFHLTGDGGASDWIYGSIRHNSSVPVNTSVPEPGRATLILIGAAGLLARRRRVLA